MPSAPHDGIGGVAAQTYCCRTVRMLSVLFPRDSPLMPTRLNRSVAAGAVRLIALLILMLPALASSKPTEKSIVVRGAGVRIQ